MGVGIQIFAKVELTELSPMRTLITTTILKISISSVDPQRLYSSNLVIPAVSQIHLPTLVTCYSRRYLSSVAVSPDKKRLLSVFTRDLIKINKVMIFLLASTAQLKRRKLPKVIVTRT